MFSVSPRMPWKKGRTPLRCVDDRLLQLQPINTAPYHVVFGVSQTTFISPLLIRFRVSSCPRSSAQLSFGKRMLFAKLVKGSADDCVLYLEELGELCSVHFSSSCIKSFFSSTRHGSPCRTASLFTPTQSIHAGLHLPFLLPNHNGRFCTVLA
jgi:hypothetical protein